MMDKFVIRNGEPSSNRSGKEPLKPEKHINKKLTKSMIASVFAPFKTIGSTNSLGCKRMNQGLSRVKFAGCFHRLPIILPSCTLVKQLTICPEDTLNAHQLSSKLIACMFKYKQKHKSKVPLKSLSKVEAQEVEGYKKLFNTASSHK